MATNPASTYGRDIGCMDDADGLFSDIEGLAVVRQDAYHRLTNDSVLGSIDGEEPNEDTDNFGFNIQTLAGMRSDEVAAMPPILVGALQRDPRIFTADVSITQTNVGPSLLSGVVAAACTTALGPFDLVLPIGSVTPELLGGKKP